ncbi:MAG: oligopeptide/dipeptide ABC transporter ATP-binding protein [Urechidicola sp.]|jgi:oligopeptide/dipeptide ABC transporter ATP-binding protein
MASPLLEIRNLKKSFPVKEGLFMRAKNFNQAVNDVSLFIQPGETLGLVGESGCGKSTLGRCLVNLYQPDQGQILFNELDINTQNRSERKQYRKAVQMIFQDPLESLNSRHTIEQILTEPFVIHRIGDRQWRLKQIKTLLDLVGLPSNSASRYPFEFSGGQRQRVGIARAIALRPELIVCDEAVSALDVSIQSQIINLLLDLQDEFNMAYLFISHDLAVVKHFSDRVAVMYLGGIVETADSETIYKSQKHPYTRSLIDSIPVPDPHNKAKRLILLGDIPSGINPPSGCRFHTRCPKVMPICKIEEPKIRDLTSSHSFSCHLD